MENDKVAKINAEIGEAHGWASALKSGHIGIQAPGNPNARGPDYITYDPVNNRIVAWDAKYRRVGGNYPKSVKPSQLQRWMSEIRNAVNALPPGPVKQQALRALNSGHVQGEIYRHP